MKKFLSVGLLLVALAPQPFFQAAHALLWPDIEEPGTEGKLPTSESWFAKASLDAAAKNYDLAISDSLHAISLFDGTTSQLPRRYKMRDDAVVYYLVAAGREKDAEDLLESAQQKITKVCGADTPQSIYHLGTMISIYTKNYNFDKAFELTDQMWSHNPKMILFDHYGQSMDDKMSEVAIYTGKGPSRNVAMARKILDKVLTAQRKYYAADDFRIAKTLRTAGEINESTGDFQAAEKNYREALNIETLYGEYSCNSQGNSTHLLAGVLCKQGQKAAADQLIADGAQRDKQLEEHRIMPKTLSQMRVQYTWWQKEARYCVFSAELIDSILTKLSDTEKEYLPEIVRLARDGLEIMNRSECYNYQACYPVERATDKRSRLFLAIINAYIALGKKTAAIEWCNKATSTRSYHPTIAELAFLSKVQALRVSNLSANE